MEMGMEMKPKSRKFSRRFSIPGLSWRQKLLEGHVGPAIRGNRLGSSEEATIAGYEIAKLKLQWYRITCSGRVYKSRGYLYQNRTVISGLCCYALLLVAV